MSEEVDVDAREGRSCSVEVIDGSFKAINVLISSKGMLISLSVITSMIFHIVCSHLILVLYIRIIIISSIDFNVLVICSYGMVLRSGKRFSKMSSDSVESPVVPESLESELDKCLGPVEKSINNFISDSFVQLKKFFAQKLKCQQAVITNLQTRLQKVEERVLYNVHATELHERKLDDLEQVSRKINLRLRGIKVENQDSPENIMITIKEQAKALDLDIPECEYDRCHRIGRKFKVNGTTFQDVLLKLCFWRTRDLLYKNGKRFNFKIFADLTQRRTELLEFARNLVEDDEVTKRAVEFLFGDQNSKLKVFSKSKLFYSFSSWEEFMNIIQDGR